MSGARHFGTGMSITYKTVIPKTLLMSCSRHSRQTTLRLRRPQKEIRQARKLRWASHLLVNLGERWAAVPGRLARGLLEILGGQVYPGAFPRLGRDSQA